MLLQYRRAVYLWGALAITLWIAACAEQANEIPLESQAQEINKTLMCPVCPSETIDQSQVELAKQMRTIVREKLAAGESREQILRFFVDRYGENVLAAPPKRGFSLLAWVIPPASLVAGGGLLYGVLRLMHRQSMRSAETVASTGKHDKETLKPYLDHVDEELRQFMETAGPADSGQAQGRPRQDAGKRARS